MNYYLIKLNFNTAVHFGSSDSAQALHTSNMTINSDTLFSAMCHTVLQMYGKESLEDFINMVKTGEFLLSDTMPWCERNYYIPKPYIISENKKEISSVKRKALKKLQWIPINSFSDFAESVRGGDPYSADEIVTSFGKNVDIERCNVTNGADSLPYQIGTFRFNDNSGLYFIYGICDNNKAEYINSIINALGMTGVGGLVSTGLGKFSVIKNTFLNHNKDFQEEWIYNALTEKTKRNILISSSLPNDAELKIAMDNACYQLIRRGGFVFSETYDKIPQKKYTRYFFKSGSTFQNRYNGQLLVVGNSGAHPVYRYAKAMFLGVDL